MAQRLAGRFEARPMAAIQLTPLVPVLLVVVVALAAAGKPPETALALQMPGCTAPWPDYVEPPRTVVSVLGEGRYAVDGQAVTREAVPARVRSLVAARGASVVYVRASEDMPYARVLAVTALLKETRLRITFLPDWVAA